MVTHKRNGSISKEVSSLNYFSLKQIFKNDSMTFCLQIELREREIERLSVALDSGRSPDVLSLETRNKTNEKLIAHLNVQVMTFINYFIVYI